jgi:carbon starvation protein
MTVGWWYFLDSNAFPAIWAMFGIANQMLAVMALAIASAALARGGKRRYIWVTLGPMCFVAVTTTAAAVLKLIDYVGPSDSLRGAAILDCFYAKLPVAFPLNPLISAVCVLAILVCAAIVVAGALVTAARRGAPEAQATATVNP